MSWCLVGSEMCIRDRLLSNKYNKPGNILKQSSIKMISTNK
jgi:hypothetical protein